MSIENTYKCDECSKELENGDSIYCENCFNELDNDKIGLNEQVEILQKDYSVLEEKYDIVVAERNELLEKINKLEYQIDMKENNNDTRK